MKNRTNFVEKLDLKKSGCWIAKEIELRAFYSFFMIAGIIAFDCLSNFEYNWIIAMSDLYYSLI